MSCDSKAAEDGSSERVRSWLSQRVCSMPSEAPRGASSSAPGGNAGRRGWRPLPRASPEYFGPRAKLKLRALLVILIIIPLNIKVQ